MSEHITHLAVAEDSARLVSVDPAFDQRLLKCMQAHPEALQWGSMSRSGDTFIYPLLEKWKADWEQSSMQEKQVSYVIGWAGHLAADRTFKPVYRITDLAYYVRGYPGPSHASVHHDAVTLREVYDGGRERPFHPQVVDSTLAHHPAGRIFPAERIENALAMNFGSNLASFKHFLTPDRKEDEPFLEQVENERQRFYVEIPRYTEAYHRPDPARIYQYILKPQFYNRNDPIIQLARQIQNGTDPKVDLQQALDVASDQSLYAQALLLGHQFMMAASDFFTNKIDLDEAKLRMRTAQPHKKPLEYYVKQAEQSN